MIWVRSEAGSGWETTVDGRRPVSDGAMLGSVVARSGYSVHLADPRFESIVEADLHDGRRRNPDVGGHPEWPTPAYFHRPEELLAVVTSAGFDHQDLYAGEGAGGCMDLGDSPDDPARPSSILKAIRRAEREPSLLGSSPHL